MEGFQRPDPVLSTWDPWVNTPSKGPCLLELTFYQRDTQYIKNLRNQLYSVLEDNYYGGGWGSKAGGSGFGLGDRLDFKQGGQGRTWWW